MILRQGTLAHLHAVLLVWSLYSHMDALYGVACNFNDHTQKTWHAAYMHCHQWHWAIMIALVACTAHSTWYMCWPWSACTHIQSLQTKRPSASKGLSRALHSTLPSLICMLWGPIPNQVSCPIHTYLLYCVLCVHVCNSISPFSLP